MGFAAFRDETSEASPEVNHPPRSAVRTPRRMFPAGSRTASPQPLPPCRSRAPSGSPHPLLGGASFRRASASRPCSTFGSGIRTSPLLMPSNPILPGLCSPSRSFFATGAPRSITRCRQSREIAAPSSVPHPFRRGTAENRSRRAATSRLQTLAGEAAHLGASLWSLSRASADARSRRFSQRIAAPRDSDQVGDTLAGRHGA